MDTRTDPTGTATGAAGAAGGVDIGTGTGAGGVGVAERPVRTSARARRSVRPVPQRDPAYACLGLAQLRAYRAELQDEEGRVSYWRRILQARLDVLRAGSTPGGELAALRPALADDRVRSGRSALLRVLPADDIPPLPSLAELWERRVADDDEQACAQFEDDLAAAEEQLSAYRSALHGRLGATTAELIARYREEPLLCLVALPLPGPGHAAVSA